jgi:hypothetical protein
MKKRSSRVEKRPVFILGILEVSGVSVVREIKVTW